MGREEGRGVVMTDIINPLVSENVMGWNREVRPNNPDGYPYYADYWTDKDGNTTKPVKFWSPATDMKDAMSVVEHLRGMGILIAVETLIDRFKSTYDGEFGAYSKSAPLAICIAALKAVDVEVANCYSEVR